MLSVDRSSRHVQFEINISLKCVNTHHHRRLKVGLKEEGKTQVSSVIERFSRRRCLSNVSPDAVNRSIAKRVWTSRTTFLFRSGRFSFPLIITPPTDRKKTVDCHHGGLLYTNSLANPNSVLGFINLYIQ